jgi:uncharacterized protein YjbI with pentapeptide repeats
MNKQHLVDRWHNEPLLNEARSIVLELMQPPNEMQQSDWYQRRALKAQHPYEATSLDMAGGSFFKLQLGKLQFSGCALQYADFQSCEFQRTGFQGSLLDYANFSNSNLLLVQFLPIYASHCSFSHSAIDSCTFENFGPAEKGKGYYSELMHTNFSYCKVSKSSFSWCDFSHANLSHAQFTECRFDRADMSVVNFEGAQFTDCDFTNTTLDDTPLIRQLISQGDNRGLHKIQWQTPQV